jgi:hypothetical protein
MIILITHLETDERTGSKKIIVSHGIDESTGKSICLPPESPQNLGAHFNQEAQEWVLP